MTKTVKKNRKWCSICDSSGTTKRACPKNTDQYYKCEIKLPTKHRKTSLFNEKIKFCRCVLYHLMD